MANLVVLTDARIILKNSCLRQGARAHMPDDDESLFLGVAKKNPWA